MRSGKRKPTQLAPTIADNLAHEPDVRDMPALTAAIRRAQRRASQNRQRHRAVRPTSAFPTAPVRAWDSRYPPELRADVQRIRAGDWSGAETVIRFLESDPWAYHAGYTKTRMLRLLRRVPLDERQQNRLRDVMIKVVKGRSRMEFTDYVRSAAKLYSDSFRAELLALCHDPDSAVTSKARKMVYFCENRRWPANDFSQWSSEWLESVPANR